jgi:hypothetical protein
MMAALTIGALALIVAAGLLSWILEPTLMDRPERFRDVDRLARRDRR